MEFVCRLRHLSGTIPRYVDSEEMPSTERGYLGGEPKKEDLIRRALSEISPKFYYSLLGTTGYIDFALLPCIGYTWPSFR